MIQKLFENICIFRIYLLRKGDESDGIEGDALSPTSSLGSFGKNKIKIKNKTFRSNHILKTHTTFPYFG